MCAGRSALEPSLLKFGKRRSSTTAPVNTVRFLCVVNSGWNARTHFKQSFMQRHADCFASFSKMNSMSKSSQRSPFTLIAALAVAGAIVLSACAPAVPLFPDVPIDAVGMCFADFPCGTRRFSCVGANTYFQLQSFDCHHRCGPGPCSGGTCEQVGPMRMCAAGGLPCDDRIDFSRQDTRNSPCEARPDAGVQDAQPPNGPEGGVDSGVGDAAADVGPPIDGE